MSSATARQVLGMTSSVCPVCREVVPAKVVTDGEDVFLRKFCPTHGDSEAFVRADVRDYLRSQRYVKPGWMPEKFNGDASAGCPDGCGFCKNHEQHLCMPIVEITSRCNLSCPACINASGGDGPDMTRQEFNGILDALIAAERQVDVLNISGGEPLLHPELVPILDDALARPEIVRVSISTNGLPLLEQPTLFEQLRERNVVVSLQMDGFDDAVYEVLRGRSLLREKREILRLLEEVGITTSLTMTAAAGINEDQFPAILEYLFAHQHVVSLMIQPLAFAGRGAAMTGQIKRLTIPGVIRCLAESGPGWVDASDFVPLPCSHPLCFSLAFYLMPDEGPPLSVNRLADAETLMDSLANRIFFGLTPEEHSRLKDIVYDLWSGPAGAAPDGDNVLKTLRSLLRELSTGCGCGFDPRNVFMSMERRVKSIFIHAFQDAETFDLARVRRCCQAYPQRDGSLVPACVHNVLRRKGD